MHVGECMHIICFIEIIMLTIEMRSFQELLDIPIKELQVKVVT
jgi:hypothetical protein